MAQLPWVKIFGTSLDMLLLLTEESAGRVIHAVARYAKDQELPAGLDGTEALVFDRIRENVDGGAPNLDKGIICDFLEKEVPEDWLRWDLPQRLMYWGGSAKGDIKTVPRTRICAMEIWCEAFGKQKGDLSQTVSREINRILERQEGWRAVGHAKSGKTYGTQRCFERLL